MMRKHLGAIVLAGMCVMTPCVLGQTVVIPPLNATQPGSLSIITAFAAGPRTYQIVIPGVDLAGVPGADAITGFKVRTRATGTVPSSTLFFSSYDVWIGELAVPLGAALNPVFSANVVSGTEMQVRGGSLTVPAGSFPTGASPNAWSTFTVNFNLGAFPFSPTKNYVITVRHTGNGISSPGMDGNSNSGIYRGQFASGYGAGVSTTSANYTILQYQLSGGTACYANCDGSSTSPVLNVSDFGCFLTKFAAQAPYANCDGSTTAPLVNVLDFGCFLSEFAAGCR